MHHLVRQAFVSYVFIQVYVIYCPPISLSSFLVPFLRFSCTYMILYVSIKTKFFERTYCIFLRLACFYMIISSYIHFPENDITLFFMSEKDYTVHICILFTHPSVAGCLVSVF